MQVLNWCYREPSFILFFKLSSVWDGCRLMMCLFSVGPFGDILMVRVKVLKKLKIRPDGDEIFQKNSTGDEKSAINPSYQTKLSYQNILDLSTKTLIQNFFEIFVKNVIFNPNLEKTTNSNRWGKHFWYPHRLPKLGKHFQRTFLDRFSSEQIIFWVFFIQVIQKKSAPKPNWSLIKMTISSNTIIGHHFIQILVSSKSSTS